MRSWPAWRWRRCCCAMTTSGAGCVLRKQVGHLFPRLLGQSEYNQRLKNAAPLMAAALRWLADHTPATAEMLRLMDATPVPCGQSGRHGFDARSGSA
jgi:hypothetical protein